MKRLKAAHKYLRGSGLYGNCYGQPFCKAARGIAGGLLILIVLMSVWGVAAYTFVTLMRAFIMIWF